MNDYNNDNIFNVLHISDLHFGIENNSSIALPNDFKQKRLDVFEELIEALKQHVRKQRIDIVIISGDIGYKCQQEEYDDFKSWLQVLMKAINITSSQIVICPGNHDFNRNVTIAEVTSSNFEELLSTDKISNRLKPFELFEKVCSDLKIPTMTNSAIENSEGKKPKYLYGVHYFEKYNIIVVVFNSAWNDNKKIDNQVRWLGKSLVIDAKRLTRKITNDYDNAIILSVFHHPLSYMNTEEHKEKYDSKDTTLQHLTNFVSLIFNGHTHGGVYEPEMLNNGVRVFRSGAIHSTDTNLFEFEIISIDKLNWSYTQSVGKYTEGKWKIEPFNREEGGCSTEYFSYGYKATQIFLESIRTRENISEEQLQKVHPIVANILSAFNEYKKIDKDISISKTDYKSSIEEKEELNKQKSSKEKTISLEEKTSE